jgi:SagB-type dehydrogenase family enzyme
MNKSHVNLNATKTHSGSASRLATQTNIGETILKRGSTRRFARSAISKDQLMTILYCSTRGVPFDFLPSGHTLNDIYLVANEVSDLQPGNYFYNKKSNSLELIRTLGKTASRSESGYLCLGQSLFADASAVLFMITDLGSALSTFGNRGYRACQFEAGVIAGKTYLSAYALGLGASGSTFYDDAVTTSFLPHSEAKSTMIAVGIGVPAYKSKSGKILASRLNSDDLIQ